MRTLLAILLLVVAGQASAALDVVATTASLGMLARQVGGGGISVTVLAPPDRDPHMLQAKPSMMRALRDADLVVALGAELETGWLPAAITGAGNGRVRPEQIGYFEAAAQVPLLESGGSADRANGDVHPMGNPHVNLDPVRLGRIGLALAERLGKLDPTGLAGYRERARAFVAAVDRRLPGWRARVEGKAGAVLYHRDGNYLLDRLGLPVLGYIEPVPGLPPTASHLRGLVGKLKGRSGIILLHAWQPSQGAEMLASALEWNVRVVALEPDKSADADAYYALIDQWVTALAETRP